MPHISDQTYLLNHQYQDAANLDARVQLHVLFSTNPYGWQRWCFDHYALPADARVLEIGCGPAHQWTINFDRVPPGWQITLTDFSSGMLEQARQNIAAAAQARPLTQFDFKIADAQDLPFEAATFDAVMAHHMLYHVPDRAKALAEMQRVLKADGLIYLATNGVTHLRELHELEQRFDPNLDFGWGRAARAFSLDAGGAEVARFFQDVQVVRYESALNITAAEPLVNYILSMRTTSTLRECRADLQRFIEDELAQQDAIHISTASGLFIGRKASETV